MVNKKSFNLSRWAIEHSRLTICFWLAVAVAGILAFSSLKYSLFPEINFPITIIRAQANLEDVVATEQQLTIPLETALQSLKGLNNTLSSTYAGQTIITLRFNTRTKVEDAQTRVEEILEDTPLPNNSQWQVIPFNLNESPAISYALSSNVYNLKQLNELATTKILPVLNQLSGVQKVNLLGQAQSPEDQNRLGITNNASLVRFNQQQAIALQIIKTSDANTLEVVAAVKNKVQELSTSLEDIQFEIAETQANYIQEATQATIEALLGAICLAVIIIFPFLRNWRATLIAAIAIPISLLGTFIVMAVAGFQLETLTLLALALIIGIIVDDAIVEIENIMRQIDLGYSPREAALLATEEIGLTVSISTLTIVAVFLPIALMGGTLGQFFRPFGLTISTAVLTSLLVARTLSPVLAVYWLKDRKQRNQDAEVPGRNSNSPIQAKQSPYLPISPSPHTHKNRVTENYSKLLSWSLKHRKTVLGIAIASFIAGVALIPLIPQGFIPQLDRGEFNIYYTTPLPKIAQRIDRESIQTPTSDSQEKSQFSWLKNIARSPESILLRKTINVGTEIETVILNHPDIESVYTIAGVRGQPNQGKIYVKLKENHHLTTSQIQAQIRQQLPPIPNTTISVEDLKFVETADDTPVKLAPLGENLEELRQTAIKLQIQVQQLPGLVDVRISVQDQNRLVIDRFKGMRVAYLSANLAPHKTIGEASQEVIAIANELLPDNITLDIEGDSARSLKIIQEFALTLIMAISLMLITLYVPFRRWLEPLVIGLSLPLSIVGAMLALLITRSDFGMISLIGLIFLLGLLDKNAVLLLDYANQLRNTGSSRTKAILETGKIRLRPIVMTTTSTILGMLPIALGWGAGAELRQPMAVSIIGGLITSSLLSLLIVPVLYTFLEDYLGKQTTKSIN